MKTCTALLAFAACAFAAGAATQDSQFAGADKNNDGIITRDEFKLARAARFDTMDLDKDGFLSREELVAAAPNFRARMMATSSFPSFDKNGDGRVSRDEFTSAPTPGFDYADANGDGVISASEAAAARP